jgi:hypothetical protein
MQSLGIDQLHFNDLQIQVQHFYNLFNINFIEMT